MKILLFESQTYNNLVPLSHFKHSAEIKFGCFSAFERWQKYASEIVLKGRKTLQLNPISDSKSYIFVNSKVIVDQQFYAFLNQLKENQIYTSQNEIVTFKANYTELFFDKSGFIHSESIPFPRNEIEIPVTLIRYPWMALDINAELINHDLKFIPFKAEIPIEIVCRNPSNIYIAESAKIAENAYLNAQNGPIIIDEDAEIAPFCYIEGPVYIGKKSQLKSHCRIAYSSIFDSCKMAGEIANSVVQDYSNKAHDGYLGHSLLGSWVNLGAMTTTSNLKNTYGKIQLDYVGEAINSERQFLGSIIGDHSKTAIGTLLNTGTIIGCFANIYELKKYQKYIPSFTWSENEKFSLNKAIEIAKIVYSRRAIPFTERDEARITAVFHEN